MRQQRGDTGPIYIKPSRGLSPEKKSTVNQRKKEERVGRGGRGGSHLIGNTVYQFKRGRRRWSGYKGAGDKGSLRQSSLNASWITPLSTGEKKKAQDVWGDIDIFSARISGSRVRTPARSERFEVITPPARHRSIQRRRGRNQDLQDLQDPPGPSLCLCFKGKKTKTSKSPRRHCPSHILLCGPAGLLSSGYFRKETKEMAPLKNLRRLWCI